MEATATKLLEGWANESPDRLLLRDGERDWTYQEFSKAAEELSSELKSFNFKAKSRIAIKSDDYSTCFLCMFAAWRAGLVPVAINIQSPQEKINFIVQKVRPSLIIRSVDLESFKLKEVKRVETEGQEAALENTDLIVFTSGSTGGLKGACLSLRSVTRNANLTAKRMELNSNDRIMMNTPPYFISGLIHFLTLMSVGGSVYAKKGFFFGESILGELKENSCTGLGGAPAHFVRIFETLSSAQKDTGLNFMVSSGDHLPVHLIQQALKVIPGLQIFTMYGLTEVSGRFCILDPQLLPEKAGSVGTPLEGMRAEIRDERGNLCANSELGEVFIRGPLLMNGYFEEPEKNAETLTEHGLRTGDFGFKDDEGLVWLRGRKDGVFKSGAEKVSCLLIQDKLMATGLFSDVAVRPVEDVLLGLSPKAFVVPKEPEAFKPGKMSKLLKNELPRNHLPTRWQIVDQIPRTQSGKIMTKDLESLSVKEC